MRARLLILVALCALGISAMAQAEVTQKGSLRIAFDGRITPKTLPRQGAAPVKVEVATEISSTNGKPPPQLTEIQIAINRHGRLDPNGLPKCELSDIQPATTQKALEACGGALVGRGSFSASVLLPAQSAFPSEGEMFAFNGTYQGKPAILAHVYGTDPIPTSFTLPFVIGKAKGEFATTLTATLPKDSANTITGLELNLSRRFSVGGKAKSYAVAGCPAPKGFPGAVFPFAKATYRFLGSRTVSATLTRNCRARG